MRTLSRGRVLMTALAVVSLPLGTLLDCRVPRDWPINVYTDKDGYRQHIGESCRAAIRLSTFSWNVNERHQVQSPTLWTAQGASDPRSRSRELCCLRGAELLAGLS